MSIKLEVFSEQKEVEKKVRLKLLQKDNEILVVAVKANGKIEEAGQLLRFNADGTITRFRGVSTDLGFDLDDQGRIKETP